MAEQESQKTFLIEGIIGLDILPSQVSDFLKSADNSPVKFQINSPGGFVFDAIAIHNLILQYPAQVEIEILALCASSASFISTAGDIVSVFPDSVYMLHNAWLFSFGDHNKLREDADHIEKISNLLVHSYSSFSKKSVGEIKSLMDAETFLFGKEIVECGFAHHLIEEKDFLNDNIDSALDYSKKTIQSSFARMSAVKSFNNDILSASALIDKQYQYAESFIRPFVHTPTAQSDADTAPTAHAIPPGMADEHLHQLSENLSDTSDNASADNTALFNLFEKLSFIENKIDSLYSLFNQSFHNSTIKSFSDSSNLPAIDFNFFEYRLNALVNARMILPAHKELILNIVQSINQSFNQSITDLSDLFSLFEKLISLPSAQKKPSGINLEEEINLNNTDDTYYLESFALPVDPQSRNNHLAILDIMKKQNCSYISAYSIFNQLNK